MLLRSHHVPSLVPGSAQLLQPENVDADALKSMARTIATEVGLPEETPFCAVNPVHTSYLLPTTSYRGR